jgi:ATPase subunit of ABC transporter with duplicated ATPase domains
MTTAQTYYRLSKKNDKSKATRAKAAQLYQEYYAKWQQCVAAEKQAATQAQQEASAAKAAESARAAKAAADAQAAADAAALATKAAADAKAAQEAVAAAHAEQAAANAAESARVATTQGGETGAGWPVEGTVDQINAPASTPATDPSGVQVVATINWGKVALTAALVGAVGYALYRYAKRKEGGP